MKAARPQKFLATIYKVGINRCVDVPEEIARSFRRRGYVPVIATVAGRSRKTTLVPGRGGKLRLFIERTLRKAAGVDAGDMVGVLVALDRSPELPVPDDLARAVARSKRAQAAFDALTPGLRREFVRFVERAKHPETRQRYVARSVEALLKRAGKQKPTKEP